MNYAEPQPQADTPDREVSRLRQDLAKRKFRKINRRYEALLAETKKP